MDHTKDRFIVAVLASGKYHVDTEKCEVWNVRWRGAGVRKIVQTKHPSGYMRCALFLHGRQKKVFVHRLMMIVRHGLPPVPGMDVNHKNGVHDDNRDANLEWCTRSANLTHSYRELGRVVVCRRGIAHPFAKLGESEVREIRALLNAESLPRGTRASIARRFGVSSRTVTLIERRRVWSHVA